MASHSKAPPRSRSKRGSKEADLTARQRALYALPLSEFTRARDALAKELASEGRAKEAQATRKLKRPVLGAWVVNQLAHQHPEHVEELLVSARDLEKAQRRALSGLSSEAFKEATRGFQRAIDTLMNDTTTSLAASGRAAAGDLIRQADETLRAAALGTAEEQSALMQGMLTRPLRSSGGFGDFAGIQLVGPAPKRAPSSPAKQPPAARQEKPTERPAPAQAPTGGKVLHGPWTSRVREEEAPPRPPPPGSSKREFREEARAQARRDHELEQRQRKREARQQAQQAEQAQRLARQELVRTKAVLRTAEAKTRYARGSLEAAEARAERAREALEEAEEQARQAREALEATEEAERARAEEVSQVEQQAKAAEQALTHARRQLQRAESRRSH